MKFSASLCVLVALAVAAAPAEATYKGRNGTISVGFLDNFDQDTRVQSLPVRRGGLLFELGARPSVRFCTGTAANPPSCAAPVVEAWAPRGRRYAATGQDGLSVFDRRGTTVAQVDPDGSAATWAPDGKRLSYLARRDVWVANADGSRAKQVTHLAGSFMTALAPAWSSRDQLVIGRHHFNKDVSDLFTVDPGNGKTRRLLSVAGSIQSIDWSPDGRTLLFGAGGKLYRAASNGRHLTRLRLAGPGAVWSPDGKRIAGFTGDADKPFVVMRPDGSHPRRYSLSENETGFDPATEHRDYLNLTWRPR
jgi:dipeptidyl aminopeptidase/acylaminoacyl peptidase